VDAGFTPEGETTETDLRAAEKRRATLVLRYSYALLTLTVLLTLVGVTAALWYMAWWIALAFAAMVAISQAVVFRGIFSTNTRWRPPPGLAKPKKEKK
jgi:NhaP-type Na+/H+ or K+/H+ antiporter